MFSRSSDHADVQQVLEGHELPRRQVLVEDHHLRAGRQGERRQVLDPPAPQQGLGVSLGPSLADLSAHREPGGAGQLAQLGQVFLDDRAAVGAEDREQGRGGPTPSGGVPPRSGPLEGDLELTQEGEEVPARVLGGVDRADGGRALAVFVGGHQVRLAQEAGLAVPVDADQDEQVEPPANQRVQVVPAGLVPLENRGDPAQALEPLALAEAAQARELDPLGVPHEHVGHRARAVDQEPQPTAQAGAELGELTGEGRAHRLLGVHPAAVEPLQRALLACLQALQGSGDASQPDLPNCSVARPGAPSHGLGRPPARW
jgi:hypothetical protein